MMRLLIIVLFTCACFSLQAQVNIITTIGGNGIGVYGDDVHDGGPATDAQVRKPEGLCLDKSGNIYIAEAGNNRVRKINMATGIITTIAGTGDHAFSGDNGPAINAKLLAPTSIVCDSSGNVFFADGGNHRIRKISLTGIVTTVVGSGPDGLGMGSYSGDGGMATNATLNIPVGICLDKSNNFYIADNLNNRIRKVDAVTGIITTIAGTGVAGYSGDGGLAVAAQISDPGQPFVDNSGNIFFSETSNNLIRKVDVSTGIISTVAGNGTQGYSGDGGPATAATLNQPYGMYIDKQGNIFFAEWGNGVIRRIDGATGIISTVAGTGTKGYSGDGGPATAAQLIPDGVFLDKHGRMYIADYGNNRIRMVEDTTQHYVGTNNPSAPKGELHVYPNPANDELVVESVKGSEVSIYNVVGVKVYSEKRIVNSKVIINTSSLVPAMYILEAVDPSTGLRMTRRFVKE